MRLWHELVAVVGDVVPGGVRMLGLILLVITTLIAVLWYWWPEWLPGRWSERRGGGSDREHRGRGGRWRWLRWPGFRALFGRWRLRWSRWRLRWRWHRRRREDRAEPVALGPDELPEVPAVELLLSADELAAQGRYREAVRERLRGMVRDLVERGVIENRPGWTVTELARAAGWARPATAAPLDQASEIFSGIWYGQREAWPTHDTAMREHAAQVRAALEQRQLARVGEVGGV